MSSEISGLCHYTDIHVYSFSEGFLRLGLTEPTLPLNSVAECELLILQSLFDLFVFEQFPASESHLCPRSEMGASTAQMALNYGHAGTAHVISAAFPVRLCGCQVGWHLLTRCERQRLGSR